MLMIKHIPISIKSFCNALVLLAVILIVNCRQGIAQEIIQIKNIKGIGIISGNTTERQALQFAVSEAKNEALIQAGISEYIQVYEFIYRKQVNYEFSELFNTDILAEMQGAVKNFEIVTQSRRLNPTTELFEIEVVINADVIKYETKADPAFQTKVTDIKSIYENGETINFEVTSALDAYLSIFNITDERVMLLYPNRWEEKIRIEANKIHPFPFGNLEYALKKNSDVGFEVNRLIFVFTKTPISFLTHSTDQQITTSDDIFSWIYSIPPDQRTLEYHSFTIR